MHLAILAYVNFYLTGCMGTSKEDWMWLKVESKITDNVSILKKIDWKNI